jgi:uncharacterized short protein YbdD (DUF466 family)
MHVLNGIYLLQLGLKNFQLVSFLQNIHHMVAQMAGPQAYDKFVEYMHHVKKPTTMAPSTLVDHRHCFTMQPICLRMKIQQDQRFLWHSSGG